MSAFTDETGSKHSLTVTASVVLGNKNSQLISVWFDCEISYSEQLINRDCMVTMAWVSWDMAFRQVICQPLSKSSEEGNYFETRWGGGSSKNWALTGSSEFWPQADIRLYFI